MLINQPNKGNVRTEAYFINAYCTPFNMYYPHSLCLCIYLNKQTTVKIIKRNINIKIRLLFIICKQQNWLNIFLNRALTHHHHFVLHPNHISNFVSFLAAKGMWPNLACFLSHCVRFTGFNCEMGHAKPWNYEYMCTPQRKYDTYSKFEENVISLIHTIYV